MVQLCYYEQRGKRCRKLLRLNHRPYRVLLFAFEGWAHPAVSTYWLIKFPWWSRKRCKVVQVTGSRRNRTRAKVSEEDNSLVIQGRFHEESDGVGSYFCLLLTSYVSEADFHMGYSLTGTLHRGDTVNKCTQMTHYAMVRRKGY